MTGQTLSSLVEVLVSGSYNPLWVSTMLEEVTGAVMALGESDNLAEVQKRSGKQRPKG